MAPRLAERLACLREERRAVLRVALWRDGRARLLVCARDAGKRRPRADRELRTGLSARRASLARTREPEVARLTWSSSSLPAIFSTRRVEDGVSEPGRWQMVAVDDVMVPIRDAMTAMGRYRDVVARSPVGCASSRRGCASSERGNASYVPGNHKTTCRCASSSVGDAGDLCRCASCAVDGARNDCSSSVSQVGCASDACGFATSSVGCADDLPGLVISPVDGASQHSGFAVSAVDIHSKRGSWLNEHRRRASLHSGWSKNHGRWWFRKICGA